MPESRNRLDALYAQILARRHSQGRLRRLAIADSHVVDFSSNDYLSLSSSSEINENYRTCLNSFAGEVKLGSGGSRLLDGNTAVAESLESTIAAFHNAPAGLLFNSGFEANTGLFACAPQIGDVIVYDELIHASVHDGMKLSRATKTSFSHNLVEDDLTKAKSGVKASRSLDKVLQRLLNEHANIKSGRSNVFIAVEGVYSMDGDAAPLEAIVECVERQLPLGNGHIIIDEAHSTGVIGDHGRGLVSSLGLESRVWARVHTFGKAMGCSGAIVLCSPITRDYLINYARSLIYTTAMAPPMLLAIQVVYEYLITGRAEHLRENLHSLTKYAHGELLSLISRIQPAENTLYMSTDCPTSPILPIFTNRARKLAERCQQRGFLVRPITAPTVPRGTDRVRLCLHAENTVEQVDGLCNVVREWLVEQVQTSIRNRETVNNPPSSHVIEDVSRFTQKGRL